MFLVQYGPVREVVQKWQVENDFSMGSSFRARSITFWYSISHYRLFKLSIYIIFAHVLVVLMLMST